MNRSNPDKSATSEYYKITESLPPSRGLVEVVNDIVPGGIALDMGCGAGRDTAYLLKQGFAVTAVDVQAGAGDRLQTLEHQDRLTFVNSSFDQFPFPIDCFDLVNAHYSLPFNSKASFAEMFESLKHSLKNGGVFVGQLFGVNDEWNTPESDMTFHTKEDARRLMSGFDVIKLEELDEDSKLANGTPKHWHFFDIIVKKLA